MKNDMKALQNSLEKVQNDLDEVKNEIKNNKNNKFPDEVVNIILFIYKNNINYIIIL